MGGVGTDIGTLALGPPTPPESGRDTDAAFAILGKLIPVRNLSTKAEIVEQEEVEQVQSLRKV